MLSQIRLSLLFAFAYAIAIPTTVQAEGPSLIEFSQGDGKLTIVIDGLPAATYYYNDPEITRPFFAHVRVPSGIQVTRHHPPVEGQDLTDHGNIHPGIWLAFGDISGSDYWRLKAPVRHAGFIEEPRNGLGEASFAVRNHYMDQSDPSRIVCKEVARYRILSRPAGHLLVWDSTFSSDREFYFGDQEEMGLGVRVATPLRVGAGGSKELFKGTGTMLDSMGRKNESNIWGNSAEWCDFSGTIAGQRVGVTLFCHPKNFRPSWLHSRDYGFMEANPFGRKAFGKGEPSRVIVKPGEKLRLRYGVLLHSDDRAGKPFDATTAFKDYLQVAAE